MRHLQKLFVASRLLNLQLWAIAVTLFAVQPGWTNEIPTTPLLRKGGDTISSTNIKKRSPSSCERPVTSGQMLLVQSPTQTYTPDKQVVQVTSVKAHPTSIGMDVILQTSKGQQLQVVNRSSGNSFIVLRTIS